MKHASLVTSRLLAGCMLTVTALGGTAWAGDPLDGLTPMSSNSLGGVAFHNDVFQIQNVKTDSPVTGNTVQASNGGRITNGAITNNLISNNQGITTVLANTGNNVSLNNAMVLNLNLGH